MPPIETSVSQPVASASAARYSSLRTLLPPNAMPLLQSSRLAQISTLPPSAAERRGSRWTGDGPNSSDTRGKSARLMGNGRQFEMKTMLAWFDVYTTQCLPQQSSTLRLVGASSLRDWCVQACARVDPRSFTCSRRTLAIQVHGKTDDSRSV